VATATMVIKDLLARDLDEKIEEIIKLEQADEETVYRELTEYVATNRIRDHYRTILKAMAEAPARPHEGVGIWISGFFGSGKSSFAKNLGYVLADRTVAGRRASDLFKQALGDREIALLVDSINARIPTEVVMFDVSVNRAVRTANESIAEIMYTVLLKHLGYAEDYDIAELEMQLEAEGKLQRFEDTCLRRTTHPWQRKRTGATRMSDASAILHEMDPATYPQADSWARSLGARTADITIEKLVDRAFELMARRRPDKAFAFIIDEVGQYVARSAAKIEDLRAVVERFGQESRNRVSRRQAIAPVWIAVTSQEKLEEVVAAIDSKRVELAKVQDRFSYRVDLAPADIREVATKRVLGKRPEAVPDLRRVYAASQGQLNTACHLEHTSRKSEVGEGDFVQFYPYLPHYIELSIDIVSGIRVSQPGAPQHLGGSNRTIIKQAHEMLVSPRTGLAERRVGSLVSLDLIFELVEGNLSSEKQKDVSDIAERFKGDPRDGGWAARVAKAICLLELVRDLPRTEANIAALLVSQLGQPAPRTEVAGALQRLQAAQFVRHTEEGYKLQTAQEKNWEKERHQFDPKPRERNYIKREALRAIFDDPKLRTYRYKDLRSFRVGLTVEGVRLDDGHVPLTLLMAEGADPGDPEGLDAKIAEAQSDSRAAAHQNDIYWVFALTPEVHDLIGRVYAARQMIAKYNQASAQGQLMRDYIPLLESEKREEARLRERLREKMLAALGGGRGFFRGVSKDASMFGRTTPEVLKGLFDFAVPDLYPKLEMGVRRLRGAEAEEALKAANLSALPGVFHGGEAGLGLVGKDGAKFVANLNAPVAKELLDHLTREQAYGNRVTGKDLETKFTGVGYGWELELIKLVLALLLRAGAIEVTYQGRRYRNSQDPQSRTPFTSIVAFRSASFTSRESIDLKTLTAAVRSYEALTGEEVDVEEGAIAQALKSLADDELRQLQPVAAKVQAHRLPVPPALNGYEETLGEIRLAASDDCVRLLAGQGNTLKELREQVSRIRQAVSDAHLALLRRARVVLDEQWPALKTLGVAAELDERVGELRQLLDHPSFYEHLDRIDTLAGEVAAPYATTYRSLHDARHTLYTRAQDDVKGRAAWAAAPEEAQAGLLAPLARRACEEEPQLGPESIVCGRCYATLSQMETEIAAVATFSAGVAAVVQEFVAAPSPSASGQQARPVRRVHAAEFFGHPLDSDGAIDEAIDRLRDRLYKLVAEGARVVVE